MHFIDTYNTSLFRKKPKNPKTQKTRWEISVVTSCSYYLYL